MGAPRRYCLVVVDAVIDAIVVPEVRKGVQMGRRVSSHDDHVLTGAEAAPGLAEGIVAPVARHLVNGIEPTARARVSPRTRVVGRNGQRERPAPPYRRDGEAGTFRGDEVKGSAPGPLRPNGPSCSTPGRPA